MHRVTTARGLEITLPDHLEVVEDTAFRRRRRGGAGARAAALTPDADRAAEADVLVAALEEQEMTVFDDFEINQRVRRRGPEEFEAEAGEEEAGEEEEPSRVRAVLSANEDAVLLIEEDGVYRWQQGSREERPLRRRGPDGPAEPAATVVTFEIVLGEPPAAEPGAVRRRDLGDAVEGFFLGRARAWVFRFVAGKAVSSLIRFLERKVRSGPVMIGAVDPAGWTPRDTLAGVALPADRPARVLLFVHGTFSSTVGSFGALASQPEGRGFLEWALGHYDLVLGYDHRTLSESPGENAVALLAALETASWPRPPRIDVICFSRGGLVYRSLVEQVLPGAPWRPVLERSIFVACTSSGTLLAEPEKLEDFLDLYTNLAVGASRLLGLIPQVTFAAHVLREAVKSLGIFAKYLARTAITERRAPGLAAMEPDGEFVRELNGTQDGQPTAQTTTYYAVTSSFEPSAGPGPEELPKRFVRWLADGAVDRLMGEPNDLVVHVASMTAFDPDGASWIDQSLPFGDNGAVYHTVYFHQPAVQERIHRWLEAESAVGRTSAGSAERTLATDIEVVDATTSPSELGRRLARSPRRSRYTIFDDSRGEGPRRRFTMKTDDVLETLSRGGGASASRGPGGTDWGDLPGAPDVDRGFDLGDLEEAVVVPASRMRRTRDTDQPVVVTSEAGDPLGVIEPPPRPLSATELRENAAATASAAPALGVGEGRREEAPAPEVNCQLYAEMPEEVPVGERASLVVELSRETIERVLGPAAAVGSFRADAAREIHVDVVARDRCRVVGEARETLPPPAPGARHRLIFDIEALEEGPGEVWVLARQERTALTTLVLSPTFVADRAAATGGGRVRARADGERLPADAVASDKLYIVDRSSGGELRLEFLFDSPTLSENLRLESDPIRGDRSSWIGGLYRDIESFWAANQHDFDGFMSDLRAFGATLFEELVPERLQELLWEHRDRLQAIQVLSSEPFVPWEVLHLKEPGGPLPREGHHFFAELGLVRWLMNRPGPPRHLRRPGKAIYVVPDYPVPEHRLPGAQEEKRLLEEIWSARALHPATAEDVKDLLASPGDLDLLHFACHGEAASEEIRNAHLMMAGRIEPNGEYRKDVLNAIAVEQYAALSGDGRRPLVFLNACQIGRAGYQLTGLGGFAEAFLETGAGAFVGTLWSVGDQPALHFADGFYRRLAAGDTVVEATRAGRREARDAREVTWLAYVVYADPYARMV